MSFMFSVGSWLTTSSKREAWLVGDCVSLWWRRSTTHALALSLSSA